MTGWEEELKQSITLFSVSITSTAPLPPSRIQISAASCIPSVPLGCWAEAAAQFIECTDQLFGALACSLKQPILAPHSNHSQQISCSASLLPASQSAVSFMHNPIVWSPQQPRLEPTSHQIIHCCSKGKGEGASKQQSCEGERKPALDGTKGL